MYFSSLSQADFTSTILKIWCLPMTFFGQSDGNIYVGGEIYRETSDDPMEKQMERDL